MNPSLPPPHGSRVIDQNISALLRANEEIEKSHGAQHRWADSITAFSGTMTFVYLHVIWFGVWLIWNLWLAKSYAFDPYPFGMLTTIVSLEAIFLSTFVLITQKRQARVADQRADLDVQINLLAEHEVTRLLRLTDAIARRLGIESPDKPDLQDLEEDIEPQAVLRQLNSGNDDQ